jgi:hypothetical protein
LIDFLLINTKDKSAIIEKIKVPIHISPIYGTFVDKGPYFAENGHDIYDDDECL